MGAEHAERRLIVTTDSELEVIIKEACERARNAGYAEGFLAGYIEREIEVQSVLLKKEAVNGRAERSN